MIFRSENIFSAHAEERDNVRRLFTNLVAKDIEICHQLFYLKHDTKTLQVLLSLPVGTLDVLEFGWNINSYFLTLTFQFA